MQTHLLPRYRWKADQNILQWTAKQRSLIFYNLCFVGYPRKEEAQENFSSIPGYQRIANEKHYYIAVFPRIFSFHAFAIGVPNSCAAGVA